MPQSDNEILEKCQSGDQDAFGQLYNRYIDQIYKFIYLKLWDVQKAEDVTSDVFFKVFNKITLYKIDGAASFRTWIFKVAYHTLIDYFRSRKEVEDVAEWSDLIGYESDFGKDLDNKEAVKKVLAFLDTQSAKVKEICIMRFWDDLSFKEIAQITGESVDNCKKIVSRTLQKMPTDIVMILIIIFMMVVK